MCAETGAKQKRRIEVAKKRKKKKAGKTGIIIVAILTAAVLIAAAYLERDKLSGLFPKSRGDNTTVTAKQDSGKKDSAYEASKKAEESKAAESGKAPTELDMESAEKRFRDFIDLYYYWYSPGDVYQRVCENNAIRKESGATLYLVNEPGVNLKEDIREKFSPYCTDELYGTFCDFCAYRTMREKLFVEFEPTSACEYQYIFENVSEKSDTCYVVTTTLLMYTEEPFGVETVEWYYEKTENGTWLLTHKETVKSSGDEGKYGLYEVKTKGSDLNMRQYPSVGSDVVCKIGNGDEVEVISWFGDWAYVMYAGQFGWVSTEYLALFE